MYINVDVFLTSARDNFQEDARELKKVDGTMLKIENVTDTYDVTKKTLLKSAKRSIFSIFQDLNLLQIALHRSFNF